MSLPVLATGQSTVSVEELHALAQANNFAIEHDSSNEKGYLLFANAFDAVCKQILERPEYSDPRLAPTPVRGERTYSRPDKHENPLNAWMHKTDLVSADPAAANGPLAGRTIALKDNISVAGLPLGLGCDPSILNGRKHPTSPIDATIVKRLLAAGARIKGTATCENLSWFPLSFTSHAGDVHNAWQLGYATGGSSSGCASLVSIATVQRARDSAVASDHSLGDGVDMAIGGDQGGSIRLPSGYSGLYGLKPTHGLVPYTGIAGLIPMIDHTGPMCQSVEDCALVLRIIAGYDGLDFRMTPESPMPDAVLDYPALLTSWIKDKTANGEWTSTSAAKGLKIGILKEAFEIPSIAANVVKTVKAAAERFSNLGAVITEVSIPMHSHGSALWNVATRELFPHFISNKAPDLLGFPMPYLDPRSLDQDFYNVLANRAPSTINSFLNATHLETKYGPALGRKAMMHVHELRAAYDKALQNFDVLLLPTTATVAPKLPSSSLSTTENPKGISEDVLDIMKPAISSNMNTSPFNLTGHPGMSIPVGRGQAADDDVMLPIGMQLVAKRFDEMSIFKAAKAWEQGGSWLAS